MTSFTNSLTTLRNFWSMMLNTTGKKSWKAKTCWIPLCLGKVHNINTNNLKACCTGIGGRLGLWNLGAPDTKMHWRKFWQWPWTSENIPFPHQLQANAEYRNCVKKYPDMWPLWFCWMIFSFSFWSTTACQQFHFFGSVKYITPLTTSNRWAWDQEVLIFHSKQWVCWCRTPWAVLLSDH